MLTTHDLKIGYQSTRKKSIIVGGPLNLHLQKGELVCLLGPNGAGKTTLLKTLTGMLKPISGDVLIEGESAFKITPRKLSRSISLVLTDRQQIGNMTVYGLVALGRSPYTGWWGNLGRNDEQIIQQSMQDAGISHMASKYLDRISDGERQKAVIARALAQDTNLVILDEPTAHLDLPNRTEVMLTLKKLAADKNKAILLSTHDLDLALQTADVLWIFGTDGQLLQGVPEDLVLDGSLSGAFPLQHSYFDLQSGSFRLTQSGDKSRIKVIVSGVKSVWIKKALGRRGFKIVEGDDFDFLIQNAPNGDKIIISEVSGQKTYIADHIRHLLNILENF